MSQHVVVVGQGYVGLPLAVRAAEVGLKVTGYDLHEGLVSQLNSGKSHIDDVDDATLNAAIKCGYRATTDSGVMSDADVIVVCVPTPLAKDGGPDLAAVRAAAATIGDKATPGTLVILESTTYPGTTEEEFSPLVLGDRLRMDDDVWIAFSPERVDPGNPTYGIQNTPKVVGGITRDSTERAAEFYRQFIDEVVPVKGAAEAEMAKLLENTFRHVNIALVNEMARFSHDFGIDIWDVIDAAGTKPFGFMPFRPGPGVGGHCIPVDPSYLSYRVRAELGYSFRMVELAEEINLAAPRYVAGRVRDLLNEQGRSVKGSTVLLLGVTYKPNIADMRETPASEVARTLTSWGAHIIYHDPHVPQWVAAGNELTSSNDLDLALQDSHVTVLLQDHSVYDLPRIADLAPTVLDTRGVLPADRPSVVRL